MTEDEDEGVLLMPVARELSDQGLSLLEEITQLPVPGSLLGRIAWYMGRTVGLVHGMEREQVDLSEEVARLRTQDDLSSLQEPTE